MSLLQKYGLVGSFKLVINLVRTKFTIFNARLIRFPIDIRGKESINVDKGLTTGHGCRIEAHCGVDKKNITLIIGKNVQINDYVHITATDYVYIGNHVLIASKVYISDTAHGEYKTALASSPFDPPAKRPLITNPVKIEDNVWLGDGVCVLPGVTIGFGSIIGANSVVNKNIPPMCIAVGIPAKVIKVFNSVTNTWELI